MQPIAENSFTITKALFYEGMLRVSRENYGKFAKKALLVLAGLWVILLIITLSTGGAFPQALGYLVILAFAGIWICVVMPRSNAKRAFRKLLAQSDGDLHRRTHFYEDHLVIGEDTAIDYSQVTQILTSRHLLILICEDRRGILLLMEGFTVGNAMLVRSQIEEVRGRK